MDAVIGKTLETAREHFLGLHGEFYKFASRNRRNLQTWLDMADEDPVSHSVRYAMAYHGLDNGEVEEVLSASLRFRVLAGILNRPVEYDTEDILGGGFCAHQEWDEETGGWPCKVPGNQEQADAWHERFGHGCACPFYESPHKLSPLQRTETELERMLLEEGMDLEEAWHQLGVRNRKH